MKCTVDAVDTVVLLMEIDQKSVKLRLESQLKGLRSQIEEALRVFGKGDRLMTNLLGNHIEIDALAARYNANLEVLPLLQSIVKVPSEDEQSIGRERTSSGPEPLPPTGEGIAVARPHTKSKARGKRRASRSD